MEKALQANRAPLRQPNSETVDSGTVRLGSAGITATFPPLKRQPEEVADTGKVRLGSAGITTIFAAR